MRLSPFVLVALVAACGTDNSSGTASGSGSAEPRDGATAFADTCARCHGDDAGGSMDGPLIQSAVPGYASYVVRTGRNEMGFPAPMDPIGTDELTDAELTNVIAWLDAAPRPTTPAEMYTRYCQNCHGENGRSGRVLKNIVRNVDELQLIVRRGHGGTNYGSRTGYMPSFNSTVITDDELTALEAYVSGL